MGQLGGGYEQSDSASQVWDQQSPYLGDLFQQGQNLAGGFQPNQQIPGQAMGAWQNQLSGQQNPNLGAYGQEFQNQLGMMNQQSGGQAALGNSYGGARHGIAESQNVNNMAGQMGRFYGDQYAGDMNRQAAAVGMAPQMLGMTDQNQQWGNLERYAGAGK